MMFTNKRDLHSINIIMHQHQVCIEQSNCNSHWRHSLHAICDVRLSISLADFCLFLQIHFSSLRCTSNFLIRQQNWFVQFLCVRKEKKLALHSNSNGIYRKESCAICLSQCIYRCIQISSSAMRAWWLMKWPKKITQSSQLFFVFCFWNAARLRCNLLNSSKLKFQWLKVHVCLQF